MVDNLSIDVSCNNSLTDGDILTLIKNIKNISKLTLNLDFCKNVTDDSLEELLDIYFKNKKCTELSLPDRTYSKELLQFIIKSVTETESLMKL